MARAATPTPAMTQVQTVMTYALPPFFVFVIWSSPSAVQLHFFFSALGALAQNVLIYQPSVRSFLGIAPQPAKDQTSQSSAYPGTMTVSGRARPHGEEIRDESGPKGVFTRISEHAAKMFTGVTSAVQGMMPEARKRQKGQITKLSKGKAHEYERRRKQAIAEEKAMHHQEQQYRQRGKKSKR